MIKNQIAFIVLVFKRNKKRICKNVLWNKPCCLSFAFVQEKYKNSLLTKTFI